ncbi:MAG: STAS domain-containing protein [Spirochaetota bacterium]
MSEPLDSDSYNFHGAQFEMLVRRENLPEDLADDFVILDLQGDLNLFSAPAVKQCLENLVSIGKNKLICDMSEVEYLDSSGLGVFIAIHAKLKMADKGGFLKILNPSMKVQSTLKLIKLNKLLAVVTTIEEALT